MAVTIEIENKQKKIPLNPNQIHKLVRKILRLERVLDVRLSLAFVTDREIRSLNKRFLGRSYTTDVLAFDLTTQNLSRSSRKKISTIDGEIVISTTSAYRNAKEFGMLPYREVALYIVHGTLHLLGYDDHSPKNRRSMRIKEKDLMEQLFHDS
ncbi:MAG: rRNA maturation RNase YbeY [Candidatus Omnitrophica bacterium]|nr:rRNA maturation RNase YbeY [Candidatus Omnitrophota bacterium]